MHDAEGGQRWRGRSRPTKANRDLRLLATSIGLALIASSAGQAISSPEARAATALPAGFVIEPVVSGLDLPTAISFTDDGRMFIAQKNGLIRVFRNGVLLPAPFIDLSADVNSFLDRGLLGMTTHPDFPQTPYVYALYTYDPPGVTDDGVGPRIARLERIAANPAQLDVAATGPGARTVLLGRNSDASVITNPNTNATLTCWQNGAMVPDCIPQDSRRHAIGTVQFGPDGALYVGERGQRPAAERPSTDQHLDRRHPAARPGDRQRAPLKPVLQRRPHEQRLEGRGRTVSGIRSGSA